MVDRRSSRAGPVTVLTLVLVAVLAACTGTSADVATTAPSTTALPPDATAAEPTDADPDEAGPAPAGSETPAPWSDEPGSDEPEAGSDGLGTGRPDDGGTAHPEATADGSENPAASHAAGAEGHQHTAAALPAGVSRPAWLGTRPLPLGPDGEALPQPTPEELVVRRIPTIDLLEPPTPGAAFASTIEPLSDEVVARSTWTPECPVAREDLRYVTVSFWGFDERPHTGELIVNGSWAEEVVDIFGRLFDARYPIEEMRIVTAEELDGTPTGDGNDTTAFVCRPTRGSTSWSQHAYGLAVDINPFINPYRRGERILPELAGAYLDRDHDRPGMLDEDSVAVQAFDAIGWGWGGRWNSLTDYMHFSANGR